MRLHSTQEFSWNFGWLNGRRWRWALQRHVVRFALFDCVKVGLSKEILTIQSNTDVVFSINNVKCKCSQETQGHAWHNQQTLLCELTLSCFCWNGVLLLLHTKLLEFSQLIMMDVLHHHSIMIDVLHSHNMFWCTDFNDFNVLHR